MDILFSNGTNWISSQSKDDNETIGPVEIPYDGEYVVVLYPYIETTIIPAFEPTGGGLFDILDPGDPTNGNPEWDNSTAWATSTTISSLRIQMQDFATGILDSNLNLTNDDPAQFIDHIPELHAGITTQLWEHNLFPQNPVYGVNDSHVEMYKIWLYNGSKVDITVNYTKSLLFDIFNYNDQDIDMLVLLSLDDLVNATANEQFNNNSDISLTDLPVTKVNGTHYIITSEEIHGTSLFANINKTGWYTLVFGDDLYDDDGIYRIMNSTVGNTFEFNLTVDIMDWIDISANPNHNVAGRDAYNMGNSTTSVEGLFTKNSSTLQDFFLINVTGEARLIVDVFYDQAFGDMNVFVFNESLTAGNNEISMIVGSSDTPNQNQQQVEILVFNQQEYIIKVNTSSQAGNWYSLNITIRPIDDEYEPNNVYFEARRLAGAGIYDELFSAQGDRDYFFLVLFAGDQITFTLDFDGSLANLNLFVYDDNGFQIGSSTSASSDQEIIQMSASYTGTHIIQVYGVPGSFVQPGVDYILSLDIIEQDDAFEPNDFDSSPYLLQEGHFPDLILRAGDEDWFQIYFKAGEILDVTTKFNGSKGDLDLIFYNISNGKANKVLASSLSFVSGTESFSYLIPTDANYLLRVVLFDGDSIRYNLSINFDEIGDPFEDNDNFDQAFEVNTSSGISVSNGTTFIFTGLEARGGDFDFFKIIIQKDFALIAEISFDFGNTFEISAFTPEQALIVNVNNFQSSSNLQKAHQGSLDFLRLEPFGVAQTDTYYVAIHMMSAGITTYNLNLTIGLASALVQPKAITPCNGCIVPDFGFNTTTPLTIVVPTLDLIGGLGALSLGVLGGVGLSGLGILTKQGKFDGVFSKIKSLKPQRGKK